MWTEVGIQGVGTLMVATEGSCPPLGCGRDSGPWAWGGTPGSLCTKVPPREAGGQRRPRHLHRWLSCTTFTAQGRRAGLGGESPLPHGPSLIPSPDPQGEATPPSA